MAQKAWLTFRLHIPSETVSVIPGKSWSRCSMQGGSWMIQVKIERQASLPAQVTNVLGWVVSRTQKAGKEKPSSLTSAPPSLYEIKGDSAEGGWEMPKCKMSHQVMGFLTITPRYFRGIDRCRQRELLWNQAPVEVWGTILSKLHQGFCSWSALMWPRPVAMYVPYSLRDRESCNNRTKVRPCNSCTKYALRVTDSARCSEQLASKRYHATPVVRKRTAFPSTWGHTPVVRREIQHTNQISTQRPEEWWILWRSRLGYWLNMEVTETPVKLPRKS